MNSWHMMFDRFGSMRESYTAIVTLLEMVLYFVLMFKVGLARGKYKVEAPSTEGPQAFQRAYRVHLNTLEQLGLHLPLLWLASVGVSQQIAANAARDYTDIAAGRRVGVGVGVAGDCVGWKDGQPG